MDGLIQKQGRRELSLEELLTLDPADLDDDERLDAIAALEAVKARAEARQHRIMAAMDADPPLSLSQITTPEALDKHFLREEIACLLHLAPVTAAGRLLDARVLVDELPATLDLLEAGQITIMHARTLVDATAMLDEPTRRQVETHVLGTAPRQTMGEFRRAVRRAVAKYDARGEEQRHEDERADRRVALTPSDHGMSELYAYLPADAAQALWNRIQADADHAKLAADGRTADQRRADALVALAGGEPGSASIEILISEATLAGENDEPAELTGYGPVPAGLARHWIKTGYRPSAKLRRRIEQRDRTCRFPGCSRRASRCEVDHIVPFNGHNTVLQNLHCLCPRHHHMKHEAGWSVQRESNGTTDWTSPTGRRYAKPPDDRGSGSARRAPADGP